MTQIAFKADHISHENGLLFLLNNLKQRYNVAVNEDTKSNLMFTDNIAALQSRNDDTPVFFVLTPENTKSLLGASINQRRTLLPLLKGAYCFVAPSSHIAREVERIYRVKSVVQAPLVEPYTNKPEPTYIIHEGVSDEIRKAFPKYQFLPFSTFADFNKANLYIDMTDKAECANIRLCQAAVGGIPCVAVNNPANVEMASSGDILLPSRSPTKQWVETIKVALRDRIMNSDKNKRAGQRFQNASDLDRQIEKVTGKRKPATDAPKRVAMIREKQHQEILKSKKNLPGKVKGVMGRRESIVQKERRARRQARNKVYVNPNAIPSFEVMETPSWFTNNEQCDVSIIVPMYKSRLVIERQIDEWDLVDDGLKKEIIYVDDLCPKRSYEVVLREWEKHRQHLKGRPIGKIIKSHVNRGYGPNCNLGAKHALGKYLVFLNADVFVLPNWVRPMYDLLESDPKIGIVGNMQIQSRNQHGLVDSAGSEWVWAGGHFAHIGRDSYHNRRLAEPLRVDQLPEDLQKPAERQMVTGCCFMMPRTLFNEIGGYDEAYKIGYWEDSEMNMAVKEKGYKVYFEPRSRVLHVGGHTHAGGHQFMKQNRMRFYDRWVKTGFIDKISGLRRPDEIEVPYRGGLKSVTPGKVVGCVIACNEEEFLEASVRSIAPLVDRFVFVIGGNHYAYKSGMCDQHGYPTDDTLNIAKSLANEFGGTVIEPPGRLWAHKTEMRNAYTKHLAPKEWMFMLDGDEVYKPGQLWILANMMHKYQCFHLQYYTFWNNIETLGVGTWDNYPQERIVQWKEGYHYLAPNHFNVVGKDNEPIAYRVPTYNGAEKFFYHYSWVRPIEKIKQKLTYYKHQLANEWQNMEIADNYVEDVFLKWRKFPASITSTHPRGGGSYCGFAGIHPFEVTKLIEQGKLQF